MIKQMIPAQPGYWAVFTRIVDNFDGNPKDEETRFQIVCWVLRQDHSGETIEPRCVARDGSIFNPLVQKGFTAIEQPQ